MHAQGYFKHQNNKPSIETVLDFSKEFKLRQKNQSHTEKKKKIFTREDIKIISDLNKNGGDTNHIL